MGLRYLGNINKPGYNPLASNITTGVNVVQYQGIFTTQQQLQAITTGQWVTDPVFDYSTLLLQADSIANGSQNNTFLDSSANNFTITRNGNTTQGTFSPFSATGWANFFEGSSAQLSIANSTNLDLGSGNWTIEAWLFPTAFSGNARFFSKQVVSGNGYAFRLQPTSGYIYAEIDTVNILTSTVGPALNTWSHVAIVRNSNTVTIYLNGVSVGSASYSGTPSSQNAPTTISGYDIGGTRAEYFPGYISNLRFVKGTAVYTSNFTPSPTPLTAVTNTQLLTCQSNRFVDNSTNAFSITLNGTPSVQAFSPFAPQFQYTATGTGGSGYSDGTGDYLTVAANANLTLGSSDFTIELWWYPTAFNADGEIFTMGSSGGTNRCYAMYSSGSNGTLAAFAGQGGSSWDIVSNLSMGTARLNSWNHMAFTRSGSTFSTYLNGSRIATTTASGTLGSNALGVFANNSGTSAAPAGYIGGARTIKGTALYTGATYTIPTAPFTAVTNTNLLLNFTNAGILDGTMKNNLETVGNAQVSTSVVKYGSGSMYFDGSGDGLVSPISKLFDFGSGNFTIEFWANCVSTSGTGFFASVWEDSGGSDSNSSWLIRLNSGTIITHLMQGGATYNTLTSPTISTNTWFHFAWVRNGNTQTMYINGIAVATGSVSGAMNSVIRQFRVGYQGAATNYLTGYIDDFRITNGFARYTQNFIPPSVALPRQ